MKTYACLFSGCLLCFWSFGYVLSAPVPTQRVQVSIIPQYRSAPVALDARVMKDAVGQKLSVTRLDFLVSDFAMRRAGGAWIERADSVAYMSARAGRTSLRLDAVPAGHYDRIRFLVGLKPEINHRDPADYPAGHPLNPTVNGLHWGWMGGYVFLALEGNWLQPDGKIGGYSYHLATDRELITVELPVDLAVAGDGELRVAFNLDRVFGGQNPITLDAETTSTHSRANDSLAERLRANITNAFSIDDSRVLAENSLMAPGDHVFSPAAFTVTERGSATRSTLERKFGTAKPPPVARTGLLRVTGLRSEATARQVDPRSARADEARLLNTFPGEGGSGGIRGATGTRKASGIREGTGSEPPGSPSPGNEIGSNATRFPLSFAAYFPRPDLPKDNPLTKEGVELGRRLFFDTRLSVNNSQSCASCHPPDGAFTDGKAVAVGAERQAGKRNSMALFNLAWKSAYFWDGRAQSLREQVLQPIENPIEMHESLSNVVAKLEQDAEYLDLFGKAFGVGTNGGVQFGEAPELQRPAPHPIPLPGGEGGQRPGEGEWLLQSKRLRLDYSVSTPARLITADRIARALEQFLLTQVACDSKFDQVLRGETKFTAEEQRGFELFHTEYDPRHEQFGADCFHCHGGPLFQSQNFANNGLDTEFGDSGRQLVTGREGDKGRFAVPSLRNVELTGPYMHDGRFKTLEEVVEHYCTGMKRSATLDPNLAKHPDGGLPLSADDKKALVAFLKTLTDEKYKRAGAELVMSENSSKR